MAVEAGLAGELGRGGRGRHAGTAPGGSGAVEARGPRGGVVTETGSPRRGGEVLQTGRAGCRQRA